ncbi:Hypothetical protein AT6N2_L1445 [Agrobacterium tumefaciens]|nr:Hypothetical protein AT6N2_L1445 [Agrobacterium tumefaciens]
MGAPGFSHLRADGLYRVQRIFRVLQDEARPLAADLAHLPFAGGQHVDAVECELVGADIGIGGQKLHQRTRRQALARTGLADDAKLLSAELHGNTTHRLETAGAGLESDLQIFDFDQHGSMSLRVENVAQAIAEEVEGERNEEDGDAGNGGDPPLFEDEALGRRNHRTPFRRRRLCAHAEEAEAGGGDDDRAHVERDAHDKARHAERRDMPGDDAPGGSAGQPVGRHEVAAAHRHGLGAGKTRIGWPCSERDGENGAFNAGLQRRNKGQREDEARKGQEHIRYPHQHRIDNAAEITGDAADGEANGCHENDDGNDHAECDAAAIENARENVAAQLIRAEPVFGARECQAIAEILRRRVVGRKQRRQQRQRNEEDDDGQTDHRQRIGLEVEPDAISVAPGSLCSRMRRFIQRPVSEIS